MRPHPHLTNPTLYISNLPGNIKKDWLVEVLKEFQDIKITINRKRSQKRSDAFTSISGRVDFLDAASAEKAFATLNLRPIPGSNSQALLRLSFLPNTPVDAPSSSVLPRLVRSQIPDANAIYDMLREFGPIHSCSCEIVQFEAEEDACEAEKQMKDNITLCAYYPRTLFCYKMTSEVQPDTLKALFETIGKVTSVVIPKPKRRGSRNSFGFISFELAGDASKALDTLDGKVIDSAPISLQFCERRAGSRGHPPEAPSPDVVYQTTEAELEATYAKVEATTPELLTSEVEISASITESQCRYTNDSTIHEFKISEHQATTFPVICGTQIPLLRSVITTSSPQSLPRGREHNDTPLHYVVKPDDMHAAPNQSRPGVWRPKTERDPSGVEGQKYRNEICALEAQIAELRRRDVAGDKAGEIYHSGVQAMKSYQDKLEGEVCELREREKSFREDMESSKLEKSQLSSSLEVAAMNAIDLRQELYELELRMEAHIEDANSHRRRLQHENDQILESLREAQAEIVLLRRELGISESRCKILELEADRKLWEESRKKREAKEREEREKADAARQKAYLEESRRKMAAMKAEEEKQRRAAVAAREAEERARRERENAERKALEKAERERKEKELKRRQAWIKATEKEECRCRDRDMERWGIGRWTDERALRRFKALSEEFLETKFSETQPLTTAAIPWPCLDDTFDFELEHLDWGKVEAFFNRAASLMSGSGEYQTLLEKSHRMFHPDRWRSRNLLLSVMDEGLRQALERKGNMVAQAITPLWRKSKSV